MNHHHQWSRRSSHRASSKKRQRRRRSERSNSSFGLPEDEEDILQMYGEDGDLVGESDEEETPEMVLDRISEQKDIMENVKFQPWPIHRKLQVLGLAKAYVMKHEGRLSRGQGYQQKGRQLLKQLKRSWNNFEYWVTPWEMRIKRIESHFGSVVTSYFIFLRWLVWVNVMLTVMQTCFVIVPEVMAGSDYGETHRKTIPEDEKATGFDLNTIWDAEGVMRYSPLFYGYYGNDDVIGDGYRLPLAYLMTTLVSFAYSFIVVLKKMANNSRQSRMSNKDEQFTFSWKLFSDWDFMVGNPETATTKHASIVTTMKEAIVEEQEKKQDEKNYLLVFLRVLANVILVMLLALSTYVVQLFVDRSRSLELKKRNSDYEAGFWEENEMTIIMTLISTLFPNVVDLISLMEKYHPRTSLRLQLARIFLLNLINLYTLFIALYNKQNDLKQHKIRSNVSDCFNTTSLLLNTTTLAATATTTIITTTTASPITATTNLTTATITNGSSAEDFLNATTPTALTPSFASTDSVTYGTFNLTSVNCSVNSTLHAADFCWETNIGQEVFKLTLMDLIFTLGQIAIIDVIRSLFVKYANNICCWDLQKKFPEYPDFKTAENLLHLINNQGMIWLGAFFAPGLPLFNLLKLLLLMYIRCWTVMVCNAPQERIFRASRSNNFYFALLLVMLFLCMLPPLFAIVGIEPSPTCGPFSGFKQIYNVLTKAMEDELPASFNSIIEYAASPGVILPIFMLLGMTIYYLMSVGRSLRDANNELRMQLEYERTEGRKKVYAMADAKHDLGEQDGGPTPGGGKTRMASAVSNVLKAAQMAKAISSFAGMAKQRKPGATSGGGDGGQKAAPAVRPKPHVPVAVVHGKRSLKKSTAAVINKAVATRRLLQQARGQPQPQPHHQQPSQPQQQQQQQSSRHQHHNHNHRRNDPPPGRQRRPITAITNGRMSLATSSSADTPEEASSQDEEQDDRRDGDEDDSGSDGSSQSSVRSTHMVDSTGHLRPATEDDVLLDIESDSEEDEEDDGRRRRPRGRPRAEENGDDVDFNDHDDDGVSDDDNEEREEEEPLEEDVPVRGGGSSGDGDRRRPRFEPVESEPARRESPPVTAGSQKTGQRKTDKKAKPPPPAARAKTSKTSSRAKVQPAEIPRITVVDFGEDDEGGDADPKNPSAAGGHVEPRVIVQNENETSMPKTRLSRLKKLGAKARASVEHGGVSPSRAEGPDVRSSARNGDEGGGPGGGSGSDPAQCRAVGSPAAAAGEEAGSSRGEQEERQTPPRTKATPQPKAPKAKFSNILARFKKMDENG